MYHKKNCLKNEKKRENLIVSAEFLNTNILEAIFLSRFLHYILTLLEMGFCEMQYLDAVSKITELSLFVSKANHSILR